MRIVIQADGRKISADTGNQPLTSGSRGVEAQFNLSADYNGLAVTAAFVAGEAKRDVVLPASGRCVVPWEVMEEAGNMLLIGVVGKDGAGNIVIPTIWCKVKLIECGAVVSGIDPEDPTPDIAAQLLQIAQETVTRAETAETGAESAKTAAETAQAGAEAARQAIEDLGVEAHTDPQGPSVEKTVDPDTGAVTLDFGIPAAPVYSVNGKTGEIELTLDDIPDGETYARTTPAQVRQIGANANDIDAVEAKIPPQASAQNQLADKDFVNSSINSSTAFFRGSFASHAALFAVPWQTTNPAAANYVTNNDYAYVADDETHNDEAWRYIYVLQPGGTGNGWQPQFKVNDSPLTAAQLAALNSGATAEIIASVADKYELPAAGIPKTDLAAGVQQSLDKADTALQAVPETYRTAADQDTIDAAQDEEIAAAAQATEETTIGPAAIASFDAAAADMPLKSLLVNIEPVQAGEGDPSPENVRPITGRTGCNIINGHLPEISWTENKTIDASGTIVDSTSNGKYSSLIPYANTVVFDVLMANNTACRVHGCDINGNWVRQLAVFGVNTSTSQGQHVINYTADESIKYIRVSLGNANLVTLKYVGTTYPITFPPEAGTVYGGKLDATNGVLTVTHSIVILTGAESGLIYNWDGAAIQDNRFIGENGTAAIQGSLCSHTANIITGDEFFQSRATSDNPIAASVSAGPRVRFRDRRIGNTLEEYRAYLQAQYTAGTPVTIIGKLASPIEIPLTPTQITTLLGTNNIWADTGNVTVTYGAYLETIKAHADRLGDSILSAIAPLETTYTASRAYAVGSYLFVGTKFYKVTAAIGSGDTINPGTNVTQTTVAAQLMELAGI